MSNYIVFDSHCDTASELWSRKQTLVQTDCCVSLPRMETYESFCQFFAFCTLAGIDTGWTCEQLFWEPYKYFMKQLDDYQNRIMLCRKGSDFDRAAESGKCAAFLALEGAEGISCDPGYLDELHEAGISMVNLTWNANNALAGSSKNDGPGLSAQGREFVRKAQRLGIIIDVSHISDRAFWDIIDIIEKPIVASHSNSRSICGHSRNLTDDQYKVICECGGYVGINMFPTFLSDDEKADLETVYTHMDHFLQLGGEHVVLGGDLDGVSTLPDGFTGVHDYKKLASYLEMKHYSHETIQNIYSNTMKKVVTLCTM